MSHRTVNDCDFCKKETPCKDIRHGQSSLDICDECSPKITVKQVLDTFEAGRKRFEEQMRLEQQARNKPAP